MVVTSRVHPGGGRVRATDLQSVAEIVTRASACELCRLCNERTQVVTSVGPADADVVVVAESPGYHDDRSGVLLSGAVGDQFETMLAAAGLTRPQVYLTSLVKCRPPTGRTPFPDEVAACEGWLFREIALVRPLVVVTLGALALRLVTGRQDRLAQVHGTMLHAQLSGRDVAVWPMLHPAAAVHVPRLADVLRSDARGLGVLLRGARSRASTDAAAVADAGASAGPEAATVQLDAASTAPGAGNEHAPDPATAPTSPPPDPGPDDEPQLSFDVG